MTRVVFVVSPEHSVTVAEATMREGDVRHLAVVDDGGALVAILSEHDLVTAAPDALVAQVMTSDPVRIACTAPAYEAIASMLQHRFNALPVVDDDGALAGIITATDAMIVAYDALSRDAERRDRAHPVAIEQELLGHHLARVQRATHPAALATAAAALETFLIQHFAREEQIGGIFDQILEEQPERSEHIRELRDAHAGILARAQRLLEANRELAEKGASEIAEGATALAGAIQQHEAHEAVVIEVALSSR